jgi:hypothetical protein
MIATPYQPLDVLRMYAFSGRIPRKVERKLSDGAKLRGIAAVTGEGDLATAATDLHVSGGQNHRIPARVQA